MAVEPEAGPRSSAEHRIDALAAMAHLADVTLAGFPRIVVDPAVCGGRPVVEGTRMRVTDVLDALAEGASEAELVADFPYLSVADVRACLAFAARAADHPIVTAAA